MSKRELQEGGIYVLNDGTVTKVCTARRGVQRDGFYSVCAWVVDGVYYQTNGCFATNPPSSPSSVDWDATEKRNEKQSVLRGDADGGLGGARTGLPYTEAFHFPPEAVDTVPHLKWFRDEPVLVADHAARKDIPIARGFIDFFPRAVAAVAELSRISNERHNPGGELAWIKAKSADHADALMRHFIERGSLDISDGVGHSVKVAWRAMAMLETELEEATKK